MPDTLVYQFYIPLDDKSNRLEVIKIDTLAPSVRKDGASIFKWRFNEQGQARTETAELWIASQARNDGISTMLSSRVTAIKCKGTAVIG